MGLTGEIKLDVLGFRTSFHLDLIEKVSGGLFSSDRSSYSDDVLLYMQRPLFSVFSQSIDAIDFTSVILSRLDSINVTDVTRC